MIYSMTGFGKTNFFLKDVQYVIELKSLNSKQADVFMRIPPTMKELEMVLRKRLIESLKRGKIELSINSVNVEQATGFTINTELIEQYKEQLQSLDLPTNDLLGALLKLPNVVVQSEGKLSEDDMEIIYKAVDEACKDLMQFREDEGQSLFKDLSLRVKNILAHKTEVMDLAPKRIDKIRARMIDGLNKVKGELEVNEERLEQELIFYIEKLDVSEEFVRLKAHCEYFTEILSATGEMKGKKLNFISQEMGREINTLGSKANDADMQKHVVQMKDELEKIKEQVSNVL